ncbi:Gelsolin, cytoplasmic, partial [Trichinella patagoniensis]
LTMVVQDEAFVDVGKQTGLRIWRVEQFKVVPVEEKEYGFFHEGDAYIVLHTSDKLQHYIHFWLGRKCTQVTNYTTLYYVNSLCNLKFKDEYGTAAIKAVELDDLLLGEPIQVREVQYHETDRFLSYFKSGIRCKKWKIVLSYLQGGVKSGFKSGKKEEKIRLFKVKGKRRCRIQQISVHASLLNNGDVFVLDTAQNIYIWCGANSSRIERVQGMEFARDVRDYAHNGKSQIQLIEPNSNNCGIFFQHLGVDSNFKVTRQSDDIDDAEFEKQRTVEVKLFHVYDSDGKTNVVEITKRPLTSSLLDTNDCFIVDMGNSGIYAWIGKKCSENERRNVWNLANDFLKQRNYPSWISVTKVKEEVEPPLFKAAFVWEDKNATPILNVTVGKGLENLKAFDKEKKHSVEAWRIDDKDQLIPISNDKMGILYADECFLFRHQDAGGNDYVHLWQGAKCNVNRKQQAKQAMAKISSEHRNGKAAQVYVKQGKEPERFLKLFENEIVILMDSKQVINNNNDDDEGNHLFRIRNGCAVQVKREASSLNSNDVFVLAAKEIVYLWQGKGASQIEKDVAQRFFNRFYSNKKKCLNVMEGFEPQNFWDAIGGKAAYASSKALRVRENPNLPARLFHCSETNGIFDVEEIVSFTQEDLYEDDVMVLDVGDEIFVWIGKEASEIEKRKACENALNLVDCDASSRTRDTVTIIVVQQGSEPLDFIGHFPNWDPDEWKQSITDADVECVLKWENDRARLASVYEEKSKTYPVELLRNAETLPPNVDRGRREEYLSAEDFQKLFKMPKGMFDRLPLWTKMSLKKKVGLL